MAPAPITPATAASASYAQRGSLTLSVTPWVTDDPATAGYVVTKSAGAGEPLVGFTYSFRDFEIDAAYAEYRYDADRTLGLVTFEVPVDAPWTFSAFGRYAGGARTATAHLHL